MSRQYKTYTPEQLMIWIPQLIARNDIHAFYISKAWLHLRAEVLKEQHYECQFCKAKGLYVPADTVHHKRAVRDAPWLALTKSNLIAVCDDCHYNIHHRKKAKWDDERW
jgi:5-methylcytosine-specific restriction endonuclease McrA